MTILATEIFWKSYNKRERERTIYRNERKSNNIGYRKIWKSNDNWERESNRVGSKEKKIGVTNDLLVSTT